MKIFIFYTNEGFTEDKHNRLTENCQILGWSEGKTAEEAFEKLLQENEYVKEWNFDNIMCQELVSDKIYYFSIKN